ncbi:NADH-quinone oxidoreductase subunit NuoF [Histomonas meleagridis]|uniref:NADH-quinone oxidoreductase subunit NuoF n=1 Tax=Histomonas meleagridis TaxID=135588 RepID=UPI0035594085|nr:NADH-quinone oxidoreductase subunit NuoF [Histomonas meleagridis]KAH0796904.1 NADH-quinone oxidoreductase subunit NuoF [Histomonas meleagridis]
MLASVSHSRNITTKFLTKENLIYKNLYGDEGADLESAKKRGDWNETDKFIQNGHDWIQSEIKSSEIRGRGGAGFSTGVKWSFVPQNENQPHYLIINADEGEPGTCKDRNILTYEPHKIVEGALLSAFAIRAHRSYVYIRGEFRYEAQCLQKAINEAYAAKLIGKNNKFGWDFDISIHRGAGAYVCGEETALLNSIEGLPGRPRFKPPYPALKGLFGCPTCVNNVETISSVPTILRRGGKWFSQIGVKGSKGTKIYCVSGCVNNPCVFEEAMGVPLRDLIEIHAGGVRGGWDNLLGVIPGGLSCPILSPKQVDEAVMSYDDLMAKGSALGTGAIIVLDKDVDLAGAYSRIASFYHHESCGQCGPCREGTGKMAEILERIANGNGRKEDLYDLEHTALATNNCICALAGASSDPIKGLLRHFRQDIMKLLK